MFEKKARIQTDSHKFHTTINFGDLFFVQILPHLKTPRRMHTSHRELSEIKIPLTLVRGILHTRKSIIF